MKKLIKKLVKKYIAKYLGEDLAAIDNRLHDLEINTGFKFFEIRPDTFTKDFCGEMAVKDAEHIKAEITEVSPGVFVPKGTQVVSKMDITELPEKWCLGKIEGNEADLFIVWVNNNKETGHSYLSEEMKSCYFHFPKLPFGHTSNIIHDDYTKISFSDFERLVLKKEQSSNPLRLEIGRWYKDTSLVMFESNYICLTKINDLGVEGYGFINRVWSSEITNKCFKPELAANEEVEDALISEAKRRGFKDGVEYISASTGSRFIASNNFRFGSCETETRLLCGEGCIFYNGIWAEIIEQPKEDKEEINFSVPGQLVSYVKFPGKILITSDKDSDSGFFSGTVLQNGIDPEINPIGHHSTIWNKSLFKLFNGSICLKN